MEASSHNVENIALSYRAGRATCMARFGAWLRERGISQTLVAGQLGLHRGHLSNLIGGKHVASEEICKAVIDFMTAFGESSPRADAHESTPPAETRPKTYAALRKAIRAAGDALADQMTVPPPVPVEVAPTPTPVKYRRMLCAEEITAVGSIMRAVIDTRPGMTAEELVSVTQAVVEGLR